MRFPVLISIVVLILATSAAIADRIHPE